MYILIRFCSEPPLSLIRVYILFLNILTGVSFLFDLDLESCVSSVSFVVACLCPGNSFFYLVSDFLFIRFVVLLYLLICVFWLSLIFPIFRCPAVDAATVATDLLSDVLIRSLCFQLGKHL